MNDHAEAGKAWAKVAFAALGVASLYAIILVLLRSPLAIFLSDPAAVFRAALVVHVQLAFVFWMLAYAAGRWSVGRGLGRPLVCGLGILLVAISPFMSPLGTSEALLAHYLPISLHPIALLGGVLVVLAVLLELLEFLLGPAEQRRIADPAGWLLASGFSLLAALGALFLPPADRSWGERAWAGGHLLQFVYLGLAVEAFVRLTGGKRAGHIRWLPAIWIAPLMPLLVWSVVAGGLPSGHYTLLMQLWLWPVPVIAIVLNLWPPGGRGDQLRPVVAFPAKAIAGLFVAGCLIGAMIRHDSLLVPAHYHAILGSITAIIMAASFQSYARPVDGAMRLVSWFIAGKMVLVAGLLCLALAGEERKSPLTSSSIEGIFHGLGLLLALAGGALAVVSAVSVCWRQILPAQTPTVHRSSKVEQHG